MMLVKYAVRRLPIRSLQQVGFRLRMLLQRLVAQNSTGWISRSKSQEQNSFAETTFFASTVHTMKF